MSAYHAGHTAVAEQHWSELRVAWSPAWVVNGAALEFMQGAGLDRFGPVKPQRWVIASFEHNYGQHGIQHLHAHNSSTGATSSADPSSSSVPSLAPARPD